MLGCALRPQEEHGARDISQTRLSPCAIIFCGAAHPGPQPHAHTAANEVTRMKTNRFSLLLGLIALVSLTAPASGQCPLTITRCPSSPPVNLNSAPPLCIYIAVQPCCPGGALTDSALVMTYGSVSISPTGPGTLVDQCPSGDGIQEFLVCFSKADLNILFASLPLGMSTVTVNVSVFCQTTGITLNGSLTMKVQK